jgi:hypothetical protein
LKRVTCRPPSSVSSVRPITDDVEAEVGGLLAVDPETLICGVFSLRSESILVRPGFWRSGRASGRRALQL